jgi:putative oxidoreductase
MRDGGERFAGLVHSAFRVVVGFLFACHGASTLFGVPDGPGAGSPAFGQWPGWWAAAIELVGGLLVAAGLGTRAAALVCSGAMAFAYFTVHQPEAALPIQNDGEPAALYAWLFLLLAAIGSGPYAFDRLMPRRRARSGGVSAGPEPAPAATSGPA